MKYALKHKKNAGKVLLTFCYGILKIFNLLNETIQNKRAIGP